MSDTIFHQILEDHKELSSLPHTLVEVISVVRREDSSASELAAIIMRDPALTTKILRIANSPYYGGRSLTSVTQAVMTLGMRAVSALTLSSSIYDMTGRWEVSIDRVRFWRHSLQVALGSRDLARARRYPCPEEIFVCGLLHDLGILVLEKSFPEKFARIWRSVEAGDRIADLEEEIWGTNHARIGQFLLEQWGIPAVICQAVGLHHNVSMLAHNDDPELHPARLVALSSLISHLSLAPSRPVMPQDLEHREDLQRVLGLEPPVVAEIEQSLLAKTMEEAKFLDIDLGPQEEILMEANRLLYQHYLALERLRRENRQMKQSIARSQVEKAAFDAIKSVTATFNRYLNDAAGTILKRAQVVETKLKKGEIIDLTGEIARSMRAIINGVATVSSTLQELEQVTTFGPSSFCGETFARELDERLRARLSQIDSTEQTATTTTIK